MYTQDNIASFDVDAQVGFTPLAPAELPVAGGDEIADELNFQASFAKFRVYSKDWHNRNAIWIATEDAPQFSPVEGDNVDIRWNAHCIGGENGADLIPGLPDVTEYDFGVYKGMENDMHPYGAVYHDLNDTISTGVKEFLFWNEVKIVIVGGLATDYCVATTVRQLLKAGFYVILNLPACRGIAEDTTDVQNELKDLGAVVVTNRDELKNAVDIFTEEN